MPAVVFTSVRLLVVWAAVLVCVRGAGGQEGGVPPQTNAPPDIAVPAPDRETRVTAGAAVQPGLAARGARVLLSVRVRVAPAHWIYAFGETKGYSVPTSITLAGDVLRPAGTWRVPEPTVKGDGSRTLKGDLLFHLPCVVAEETPAGERVVSVTLSYQVCNDAFCWPPASLALKPHVRVVEQTFEVYR